MSPRTLSWVITALLLWTPALAQIEVRDDRGIVHRFATAPMRIVSLLPSITESVCALGACDRLVGVDRYSSWPSQVDGLPKLGGLDDAQVERIVMLKPDVVLAGTSARVSDRLESLGLQVMLVQSQTHADVSRSLDLLGRTLGTPLEAKRLWESIEADIALAAARVPPVLRGKRVYFEVASTPYAAGAGSFIGETLARLGLGNVVPAELGPFPRLNPEFVVRSQPDIVMAAQRELQTMADRPGWRDIAALKAGTSCGFESAQYDILVRPGPRMGEGALILADCLARLADRAGGPVSEPRAGTELGR
jgi:iron complex transport system substrate-binding protein